MKISENIYRAAKRPDRKRYTKRHAALKNVRNTWEAHLRDLDAFISPGTVRFNGKNDKDKGKKLFGYIINSAPTVALRTLEAGMMAGVTSPARPWFRLTTPDPLLMKRAKVRRWLDEVETIMRQTLLKGNIYNTLPLVYRHLGLTGTALQFLEEDTKDVVRAYVCPPGSYCLASSERNDIDTVFREVPMSNEVVVKKFGLDNVSQSIRDQVERNPDQDVNILHVVEPRTEREDGRMDAANKSWSSCWMETSPREEHNGFLRESGYDQQPFQAIRWETTGTDTYGRGPGMIALGDARALQQYEKRKAELIDKITNPPMKGPSSLRNQAVSMVPGAMTYEDTVAGGSKFEPAQVVHPEAVKVAEMSIEQHVRRIDDVLFAPLFLMLARSDRQMTATEVAERHEEKMLQLGPVLERVQDELLDPMLDFLFYRLLMEGKLPEIPPELFDVELGIEHISILGQAQKMIRTTSVDRVLSVVGAMAALFPQVTDKINSDKVIDAYADMLGIPSDLVRSDEEVEELRAARAEEVAKKEQMAQVQQMAETGQTLSQTSTEGNNALGAIMSGIGMAPAGGMPQ